EEQHREPGEQAGEREVARPPRTEELATVARQRGRGGEQPERRRGEQAGGQEPARTHGGRRRAPHDGAQATPFRHDAGRREGGRSRTARGHGDEGSLLEAIRGRSYEGRTLFATPPA